jgi:DNA-binding transcriptional MerR regulator
MAAGKKPLLASSGNERLDKIGQLLDRPMAEELTSAQASKHYHVTLRALRFYEDQGLLSPRRPSGWRRYYGNLECKRLELILLGKKLGFSLAEIKEIINNANVSDSTSFEHLLLDYQILEQIKYLEQRGEEINSAITRLRRYLGRGQHS